MNDHDPYDDNHHGAPFFGLLIAVAGMAAVIGLVLLFA